MAPLSIAARRRALIGTLAALFALLFPSPAAAHAELATITPANGAQLTEPPTEVRMTFTESVNLVDGGTRLVDGVGGPCPHPTRPWPGTPSPGRCPDLPEGAYVITWRVVSSDGHPVSGASSFGIGTPASDVSGTGTPGASGSTVAAVSTAPWPVVIIRLAGYAAFALFAGVVAFVLWCAPGSSNDPTLQLLARAGLLGARCCGRRHPGPRPVHSRGLDEPCLGQGAHTRDSGDPVRHRDGVAARTLRCPWGARLAIAQDPHRARQLAGAGRGGRHRGDNCRGRTQSREASSTWASTRSTRLPPDSGWVVWSFLSHSADLRNRVRCTGSPPSPWPRY